MRTGWGRWGVGLAIALGVWTTDLTARQADPCAGQPQTGACLLGRADTSGVTLAGTFTYNWPDGAGGDISYGGSALGVSEDGQYLYIACNTSAPQRGIAKLVIPTTLGTQATVAAPCQGPTDAVIQQVVPGWGAGQALIGGVLEQGGRVVVSAYGSYDANGAAIASHWSGTSLTSLVGPFAGTVSPGLVKSQMGPIPPEWRTLLGGSAFATAGYTSIISRQSYGAAMTVFDPATVTANNFPMQMLIGCPHSVPSCRTWISWGPSSNGFEGAELSGGSFIIPGTRTYAVIEREASGTIPPGGTVPYEGYGYTTTTLSLHGQPYTVNPAEGVLWIYSLSDPLAQKGNKGYPYRLVAKLYDLYEAWQVKQGQKTFDQVKQYATIDLPGSSASETVQSGAYNPVRKEFYLIRSVGGGVNTIYVFRNWGENTTGGGGGGGGGGTPPPLAAADTYTMQADTTLTVNAPGVLGNDQNAPTSASVATPPASGSFTLNANGSFVYTPPAGFVGVRTFIYNATNAGGSSQATATITVQAGPPPPPSTVLTISSATTSCRVVLTAAPPTSTGWGVQFTYARPGGATLNFGSRDTAAPYTRTLTLGMGTYTLGGTWTKTGATPVTIAGQTFVCPEP